MTSHDQNETVANHAAWVVAGDEAGPIGNERLTALTGAVLLVLAAVEIVTVPTLRAMLSVHFVVGVLLIGPVVVKTASTGYRFIRYYTHAPAYRRKGPPRLVPRITAPVLLASTLTLLGSGIALAFAGPAPRPLLALHKASFLIWTVCLAIHLISYLRRVPRLVADDWRAPVRPATGRRSRLAVNVIALVAGAIAAILLLPTTTAWIPWMSGVR